MKASTAELTPTQATVPGLTIGQYLIVKLEEYGIRHGFGIPGDYVLGFYDLLQKSRLQVISMIKAVSR